MPGLVERASEEKPFTVEGRARVGDETRVVVYRKINWNTEWVKFEFCEPGLIEKTPKSVR